ncbi:MAG: hypothetical protein E5X76_21255 [Mesorhizobium sp.]|nr:MAG: hypothetical protein E5X77_30860 [Mesorhizobium sp.]TJV70176.1 MAG: hypothetical protein E5X76_21255 [Mesorhizobium sp.]
MLTATKNAQIDWHGQAIYNVGRPFHHPLKLLCSGLHRVLFLTSQGGVPIAPASAVALKRGMKIFAILLLVAVLVAGAIVLLRRSRLVPLSADDLEALRKLPQQIRPGADARNLLRLCDAGLVDTIDVEGDFGPSYLFVLNERGKRTLEDVKP